MSSAMNLDALKPAPSNSNTLGVGKTNLQTQGSFRKENNKKKKNARTSVVLGAAGGVSFKEINDVISPDSDIPLDILKKFNPKFPSFLSRKLEFSSYQIISFSENNEKTTESSKIKKNDNIDIKIKIHTEDDQAPQNVVFTNKKKLNIRKRLEEEEIELVEPLEKTSYVNVYKAFYKENFVILKIGEVGGGGGEETVVDEDDLISDFQNEHNIYDVLFDLENANINNVISVYAREKEVMPTREKTLYAVMACEFGRCSMDDILKSRSNYTEGEIIGIFYKLTMALAVAHSARIAHRNINTKNLTLNEDMTEYILCGFGTGYKMEDTTSVEMSNEIIQKKHYLPPELYENYLKFKDFSYDFFKADIYSLGVCVLAMMGFKTEDELQKMRDEKSKTANLKELEALYPILVPIIRKMLSSKPGERIELIEVAKTLESHKDKVTEIDEIEYLKQYEIILNNKTDQEAIEFLEDIAAGYHLLNSFKKSIPFLERAYMLKEKVYGDVSLECAKSLEMIGNSYFGIKDHHNAIRNYEKSLDIKKKVFKDQFVLSISNSYYFLGLAHFEKMNTISALENFEKALDVLLKIKNITDIKLEIAKVEMSVGAVYSSLSEHEKAIDKFEIVLKFRREIYLKNNISVAQTLIALGNEYFDLGEYSKCLDYYERSTKIKKNILGEFHPDVALCFDNIGNANNHLGYHEKAKCNFERAIEIFQKLDLDATMEIATTYSNLAQTLNGLGAHEKSLDYYSRALKILREKFGEIHIKIMKNLLGIANSYIQLNDLEKAKLYYEDSYKMAKIINGESTVALDTAKAMAGLGSLYLCNGELKKSMEFTQNSWKMLIELNEGTKNKSYKLELAMVLNNLGKIYEKLNELKEAEKCHFQSYTFRKEILGEHHPELIISLKNLGLVYEKLGEKNKAFEKLQEALVIRRKFYGEGSPYVASILKQLADLNTKNL